MSEEKSTLKIGGMTCTGCAATVKNALEKEGAQNVYVDFSMGEAVFQKPEHLPLDKFIKSIEKSGYIVKDEEEKNIHQHHQKIKWFFIINTILTTPLLLSMIFKSTILHQFTVQLILSTPVVIIGIYQFGRSAVQSVIHKSPNMDVLILTGSLAAYVYSIVGWFISASHQYMFFETAAAIVTFMMLGNMIEQYSIAKTTMEIQKLQKSNEVKFATKKFVSNEQIEYKSAPIDDIMIGDVILIKEGEQVPLDSKILSGEVEVNESIITGESIPVYKKENDELIAGSTIIKGSAEAYVIRRKSETILAQIVESVKKAQRDKTEIQKLGDKISAIFVPAVLLIAIISFLVNYLNNNVSESMLRSIAVLVISCPCAMGLAAPTAVSVALGIAAKNRILFKASSAFELIKKANVFVFDKTGTLTTGEFEIEKYQRFSEHYSDEKIVSIVYAAESRSLHPIAKSISRYCTHNNAKGTLITEFKEEKGLGISFQLFNTDKGTVFKIGSFRILKNEDEELKSKFDVFVTANDELIAAFKLKDELRQDAKNVIHFLHKNEKQVYILSGDKKDKCLKIAEELGIPQEHVFYEKLPEEKLTIIDELKKNGKVCMTGDGINDAPAMAKADVSISFNHSSSIAMDSANVIISHHHAFEKFLIALKVSNVTYQKIKQNYFWAFFYNVIAIPIAASGYLVPIIASLSMTFSDIIVVGNSLSIYRKKW